eukprot:scaffold106482_cov66-Phaeocystis_antarctica.AAC.5
MESTQRAARAQQPLRPRRRRRRVILACGNRVHAPLARLRHHLPRQNALVQQHNTPRAAAAGRAVAAGPWRRASGPSLPRRGARRRRSYRLNVRTVGSGVVTCMPQRPAGIYHRATRPASDRRAYASASGPSASSCKEPDTDALSAV